MNEAKKPSAMDYLKAVGPAIVISAVVVGPGSVTTASSMGASYGYKLLWVIILAALASFFYQLPAIRVALAKEVTIMEAVRMRFGKIWAMVLYYCIMFGCLIFQAGNFTGAAMAMNYFVPQISLIAWAAGVCAGLDLPLRHSGKLYQGTGHSDGRRLRRHRYWFSAQYV